MDVNSQEILSPNYRLWFRILRNISSGFGGTAIILLINFALMPFVLEHIGRVGFGIWVLVNSLVGYMGFLDVGLQPTLVKKTSEYLAAGDQEGLQKIVNTTLLIYVIVGLVVGMVVLGLAPYLPDLLNVPDADVAIFRMVVYIVGFQTAIGFPMTLWRGLVGGLQDYHAINMINITSNLLRAALTYVLLLKGYGLLGLVWLGFAISALVWCGNYLWVRRRIPYLQITPRQVDFSKIRDLMKFSGSMFIWGLAGQSLGDLDKVLIGIFLPLSSVAIYEVGYRIYSYSRIILYSMVALLPTATDLQVKNDNKSLTSLYLNGTRYLILIYTIATAGLFVFGQAFIRLWLGIGYEESVLVLYILLIGSLYQAQNVIAHVMLPGMNRLRVFTLIMSAYPVVKIILGVLLISNYGLPGIALATTLTYIILETIFISFILKTFGVTLPQLLRKVHLPALLTVAPGVLMAVSFKVSSRIHTWMDLLLFAAGLLGVFGLSFAVMGMSIQERRTFLKMGRTLMRKLEARP